MEVYQITEQVNFELSVTAFESCGSEYCVSGLEGGSAGLSCSGGSWSTSHLTYSIQITIVLLWAFLC